MEAERKPRNQIKQLSLLTTDRNKWFFITIILSLITLYAINSAYVANKRYDSSLKIAWVKMSPDGTSNVEIFDSEREQEFFASTVKSLLAQYVERRFSQKSFSIRFDYGFCLQFMGKELKSDFQSTKGFNATQKAADLTTCVSCNQTYVKYKNLSHYDKDNTVFQNRFKGTLYRTNIFVDEIIKNSDGYETQKTSKIIALKWRFLTITEIREKARSLNYLKFNPIGIEIIEEDFLNE